MTSARSKRPADDGANVFSPPPTSVRRFYNRWKSIENNFDPIVSEKRSIREVIARADVISRCDLLVEYHRVVIKAYRPRVRYVRIIIARDLVIIPASLGAMTHFLAARIKRAISAAIKTIARRARGHD